MENSPLAWMGATPTTLKKLNTIQDKATPLIATLSINTNTTIDATGSPDRFSRNGQ